MTFNEIKKLLEESGEDGILFELPRFSSSERLYLTKDGELFHDRAFGKYRDSTTLMDHELADDNWMPRGWDEQATPVLKSEQVPETVNNPTSTVNNSSSAMTPEQLLELAKNWEPTPEQIQMIIETVKEMEAKFEKEAKDRRVDDELLNKRYTL